CLSDWSSDVCSSDLMIFVMKRAGFVLVGGKSSRMGRDKALLPFQGSTLLEHIALHVAAAAGSVTLIGEPDKYRRLGFPVLTDNRSEERRVGKEWSER